MNDYELICLALEEVRKQAYNLQHLKDSMEWVAMREKDQTADKCQQTFIKESGEVLKETLANLRDGVLEGITEYNNGIDNVSGVDIALSKVSFDLIYGRTTDGDYE